MVALILTLVGGLLSAALSATVMLLPFALPAGAAYLAYAGLRRMKRGIGAAMGGQRRAPPRRPAAPARKPARRSWKLPGWPRPRSRTPDPERREPVLAPSEPVPAGPKPRAAATQLPLNVRTAVPATGPERHAAGASGAASPVEIYWDGWSVLKGQVPQQIHAAQVPWFLSLGASGDAGTNAVFTRNPANIAWPGPPEAPCTWWFCEGGVVFDVSARVAGFGGETGADWRDLIDALADHRFGRPLDGILLFVGVGDLLPAAAAAASQRQPGAVLNARIRDLRRHLGTTCPVSIVLTGCETLAGLPEFARALPNELAETLLGWSADQPIGPDPAGTVLNSIATDIEALETELLASDAWDRGHESLLRLPASIRSLTPRLGGFLQDLLRTDPAEEPIALHGVYMTGELPEPDGARPVFSRDLLPCKLLVETGLGQPTRSARSAARRRVRAAQASLAVTASVLAGIAWLQTGRLTERAAGFGGAVAEIRRNLQHPDPEAAQSILPAVAAISSARLATPWLPTSLLSTLDEDRRGIAGIAVERLVLDPARRHIRQGSDAGVSGGGAADASVLRDLDQLPSYRLLAEHLERSASLRNVSAHLERLRRTGSFSDLAILAGVDPAALPAADEGFIADLLRGAELPANDVADDLPGKVRAETRRLAGILAEDLFVRNGLRARRDEAVGALRRLGEEASRGPVSLEAMEAVAHAVRELEASVQHPAGAMALAAGPDLPPPVAAILDRAANADLPGPGTVAEVRELLGGAGRVLRSDLLGSEAPFAGPLFTRTAAGAYRLSEELVSFGRVMDALPRQSFMAEAGASRGAAGIEAAERIRAEHREFMAAIRLPEPLGRSLRETAGRRMAENVLARIEAFLGDQQPAGEDPSVLAGIMARSHALSAEVRSLAGTDAPVAIDRKLRTLAAKLLAKADASTGLDAAYAPALAGAKAWNGEAGAMAKAFEVGAAGNLPAHLAQIRDRLGRQIRPLVGPALEFLGKGDGEPEAAQRWRATLAALDASGGSLAALERLVSTADGLTADNCGERLAQLRSPGGTDVFARTHGQALASLLDRCTTPPRSAQPPQAVEAALPRIATAFRPLSGRFPFVASAGPAPASEADPDEVRRFYRLYDSLKPQLREEIAASGPQRAVELRLFFERIEATRPLLDGILGSGGRAPRPLRARFALEAGHPGATGASQIIDWSIRAGQATTGSGTDGVLDWTPGERIQLSFRWAAGSRYRPGRYGDAGSTSVSDDTAVISERGPWALLRLMRQRPAGAGSRDGGGDLVRIAIPTRMLSGAPAPDTIVFLGIRLLADLPGREPAATRLPVFPDRFPG
ncbi:type VI secretion system protein [Arenibaculum pallidiluteum]|uniref:type VI secretion system protein n=1 Tax=Arenibaculum pallidiluteum TaxID=2812559 RepID=UPI001A964CFC|nr:type VI secretion system protein [Arenibaculum pallidiluteum]